MSGGGFKSEADVNRLKHQVFNVYFADTVLLN